MKQLTLLLLMLCSSLELFAQSKPLYIADTSVSLSNPQGSYIPFSALVNVTQCIYYHSDFPGMPIQGQITDVYIKLSHATPKGATLKGLAVKMKPTGLSAFSFNYHAVNNIIETGLTTVFYDSNYVLKDSLAYGDWWRLPLPVPYTYSFVSGGDSARNLLIEFSLDTARFPTNNFNNFNYGTTNYLNKWLDAVKANNNISWVSPGSVSMLIGFNPKPDPVGVKEVSNTHLSLYPNPTKDYLYLSTTPRPNTAYTITDITGRKLLQGLVKDNVISVQALQPGLYLLRMGTEVLRFVKEE